MKWLLAVSLGFSSFLSSTDTASAAFPASLMQADDRLVAIGVPSNENAVADDKAPLVHIAGGRIVIAPVLADAPLDSDEALALAAILHGYFDTRVSPKAGSKMLETLAAMGVAAGGVALDPLTSNKDFRSDAANRSAGVGEQADRNPAAAAASGADRAVAMLTAAGSCTAPMVAMLHRLRGLSGSSRQDERAASLFATRVMHDLGSAIYPPDASCLR
jgi:hypothetical protein